MSAPPEPEFMAIFIIVAVILGSIFIAALIDGFVRF